MRKDDTAGIKFLESLKGLKALTLSDSNQATWTRDELLAVVRMVPKLEALDLKLLTDSERQVYY
ncbi:hypothetical protein BGX23_012705 [Mortierella sp. AD031]|nr:hypothetical protein BGX23_012705 [Mortierella sp. AD031]